MFNKNKDMLYYINIYIILNIGTTDKFETLKIPFGVLYSICLHLFIVLNILICVYECVKTVDKNNTF